MLQIVAVTNWCNVKDWKDTEQYPQQKTIANKQLFLKNQEIF